MAMEKITHFTHPNHALNLVTSITGDYLCDGCKEIGSGRRFRCGTCDFDLHDYCARAPETLSSFMDPHKLDLTVYDRRMYCDVCSEPIDGMTYSCRECNFDAHPGCTYFPEEIDLNADAKHYLRLRSDPTPRQCNVCRGTCIRMRYSCRTCNVDVHVQCIAGWKRRPATAAAAADGGGGARGRGNVRDGGGDSDDDDDMFIHVLKKVTWKVTKLAVEAAIGISLPDFD